MSVLKNPKTWPTNPVASAFQNSELGRFSDVKESKTV